jgi:hypothetical protein
LPSANIDKFGSGSDALLIFEGVLSFFGYIVIIADLLGNGITKDSVEYPFLMAENPDGLHTICIVLPLNISPEYSDILQRHISIGGYSMGGSSAMAFYIILKKKILPILL